MVITSMSGIFSLLSITNISPLNVASYLFVSLHSISLSSNLIAILYSAFPCLFFSLISSLSVSLSLLILTYLFPLCTSRLCSIPFLLKSYQLSSSPFRLIYCPVRSIPFLICSGPVQSPHVFSLLPRISSYRCTSISNLFFAGPRSSFPFLCW